MGRHEPRATTEEPLPVSEPVAIEDVFVSGIAAIEDHGGWLRVELMVERETEWGPAAVIVSRLTMTRGAFDAMLRDSQSFAETPPLALH